jgi:hypothetical protein
MRFSHWPLAARMATIAALEAAFAVSTVGCGGSSGAPSPSHDGGVPVVDSGVELDAADAAAVPDAASHVDAAPSTDASTGDGSTGITIGLPGRPGQDLVTGGAFSKSTNFTLYWTTGESPGGNGVMKSTGYKMIGGIVGTNTSAP